RPPRARRDAGRPGLGARGRELLRVLPARRRARLAARLVARARAAAAPRLSLLELAQPDALVYRRPAGRHAVPGPRLGTRGGALLRGAGRDGVQPARG